MLCSLEAAWRRSFLEEVSAYDWTFCWADVVHCYEAQVSISEGFVIFNSDYRRKVIQRMRGVRIGEKVSVW